MLYFILVWLGFVPLCHLVGTTLLQIWQVRSPQRLGDRTIAALWLGLVVLAITLLAVSIGTPLNPVAGLAVALVWLAAGLFSGSVRQEVWIVWRQFPRFAVGAIALLTLTAALVAKGVSWHDSGYYHYSVLQWLGQYGTVPGLGLIFSNLAFTSTWFALSAPFNPPSLAGRGTAVMNGLVLLLMLGQMMFLGRRLLLRQMQRSDWFLLCFSLLSISTVLLIPPLPEILVSPSPDLPMLFLVGLVGWSLLLTGDSPERGDRILPLTLAVGAFTIKLTALPLLAVSTMFFLWHRRWTWVHLSRGFGVVTLCLAPLVGASLLMSGCPLFPSDLLCLDLPWSLSPQAIATSAKGTHSVAHWMGQAPAGFPPLLWTAWAWVQHSRARQISTLLSIGAIGVGIWVLRRYGWRQWRPEVWVIGMGLAGILLLQVTSPFFRFTIAYILLVLALGLAIGLPKAGRVSLARIAALGQPRHRLAALGFFLAAWITAVDLARTSIAQGLLPPPMYSRTAIVQRQVNGIPYAAPRTGDIADGDPEKKDMCWATPIPCAYEIPQDVFLRDPERGLDGGFERRRSARKK
ncbi:MAG: hypothetical protein VKJ24_04890 [Synechococcales bacterium]|nr:hypothetical protein [Synechococcales bacterium]